MIDPTLVNTGNNAIKSIGGSFASIFNIHNIEVVLGVMGVIFIVSFAMALILPEEKPKWAKGPFEL